MSSPENAAATERNAPATPPPTPEVGGVERRVGRVDRWLNKGFGFVTDLGRLDTSYTPNTGYGWVADEHTGAAIFVYHTALLSDEETTFHRLFANEFVEYTVDFAQPQHNGRSQALTVTGIARSKLLCDLNAQAAAASAASESRPPRTTNREQPRPTRRNNNTEQQPQTVQYIYYNVPNDGSNATPPANFPPVPATQSEPSYVMPTNGIPVPK